MTQCLLHDLQRGAKMKNRLIQRLDFVSTLTAVIEDGVTKTET